MMRRATFTRTQSGGTLVELLIASTLLVALTLTVFLAIDSLLRTYSRGEQRADLQESARIAAGRMAQELRAAGLDPEGVIPQQPVQAAIQTAETSRIAFITGESDANGNDKSIKVEYRLDLKADPPVLRRQQWSWSMSSNSWTGASGAQPFANGITAVELTYYGADGAAIPSGELAARLGETQRIGLAVTASSPPGHTPPETYRLVGEVRMRNIGL
jgi:type II secretory pathway component PulJ